PHHRVELADVALLVVEVDHQHVAHVADRDVADVYALDGPAAARIRLDADAAEQVRAAHRALLGENVGGTAGDLAADDDAAVTGPHRAARDHDVAARHADTAAVGVAAGLDGDTVVARVEHAILDQDVIAGFRVAAVGVGPVTVDRHSAHRDAFAENRVNDPERRVAGGDAFDEHFPAFVGLEERRAQVIAACEHPPGHRHPVFRRLEELRAGMLLVDDLVDLPLPAAPLALPRPPRRVVRAAVQRTGARDGDVLLTVRVNERRIAEQLHAFPAGEDGRQVAFRFRDERDRRTR